MKVLFYTGYFKQPWNANHQVGIGGSEIAVINVAESLVRFGWKVVVSGIVEEAKINGVEWISTDNLHKKYHDKFDVIVGVSYIHFLLEFRDYLARKIFWAHNTDYHPWYKGSEIDDSVSLLNSGEIDQFVCLTNWHKNQWSQKHLIDPSKIEVIGNGIDTQSFIGHPPKVKNRFIWSSAPERGLDSLLDHWPIIKSILPDATLHVYSPGYQVADRESWGRDGLDGVSFKGTVSQTILHRAMLDAEYWPYLTSYEETYCITALEMQYAKVLPITTDTAALGEVVNGGIILHDDKTKWKNGIQLIGQMNRSLKNAAVQDNFNFARKQTWNSRSYDWKKLIQPDESR